MANDKLQARYTGKAAAIYDAKRSGSPRFRAEEDAFAKYFEQVKPRSVIDCPFGTGRWLAYYRNVSGPVIAVDLSDDMLAMAQKKHDTAAGLDIRYITGSAFDYDFGQFSSITPDVLVCTRFLNWINAAKAKKALSNLSKSQAKWAIIGASVRPVEFSLLRRFKMKLRLFFENLPRRFNHVAVQHVHDENFILAVFRCNGWQVADRMHIFSKPTRENYFWLLKRQPQ